jgi:cold shock CspA family protein
MIGTVANLAADRGFGFLRGEDEQRYFFHASAPMKGIFDSLRPGDHVAFEPTTGTKGLRAEQVVLVD